MQSNFLAGSKKFRAAKNFIGPVKGQGIRVGLIFPLLKESNLHGTIHGNSKNLFIFRGEHKKEVNFALMILVSV